MGNCTNNATTNVEVDLHETTYQVADNIGLKITEEEYRDTIKSLKNEISNLEAQLKCKELENDNLRKASDKVFEDYVTLHCLHYGITKDEYLKQIAEGVKKAFERK